MTAGASFKKVDTLWTVIFQLGVRYYCEQMKYNSASSRHSNMNVNVYQPGGYARGACNEGVNLILRLMTERTLRAMQMLICQ
eukprot:353626-Ditylum_brightwellii.AAC.1